MDVKISRLNFSKFTFKFLPHLGSKTFYKKAFEDYRYLSQHLFSIADGFSFLVQSTCKGFAGKYGRGQIQWQTENESGKIPFQLFQQKNGTGKSGVL